jgi:hypothetical protein
MALDFNMLRPTGGPNPVSSFFQGQQDVASNALAQEQAAQARDLNALRKQQVTGQIQSQEEGRINERRAQKIAGFRDRMLRARDPEAARSVVRMQYADPDIGPVVSQFGSLDEALADISDDPAQFEESKKMEAMGMAEYIKSLQPKLTPTGDVYDPRNREFIRRPQAAPAPVRQPPMVEEFTFARSPEGGGFTGSFQDFVIAREAAKRAPAAPRAAAAGGGGGAAPAPKPMTALQQQATRKAMAADQTSVKASQSVVGELEKLTDELVGNPEKKIAPHPGLSGITGFQAMLPSLPKSAVTSGNSRQAQQRLETLKGKVMAFGRQLASLEGKLGNMAVQEWKFVSDSIQAIDPAAGNLDVQLRDIVRQAKNFANTVQERYDLTYEGAEPTAAPSGAPTRAGGSAPGASNVDQERANANAAIAAGAPAAAVRQRFKQNTGQEL